MVENICELKLLDEKKINESEFLNIIQFNNNKNNNYENQLNINENSKDLSDKILENSCKIEELELLIKIFNELNEFKSYDKEIFESELNMLVDTNLIPNENELVISENDSFDQNDDNKEIDEYLLEKLMNKFLNNDSLFENKSKNNNKMTNLLSNKQEDECLGNLDNILIDYNNKSSEMLSFIKYSSIFIKNVFNLYNSRKLQLSHIMNMHENSDEYNKIEHEKLFENLDNIEIEQLNEYNELLFHYSKLNL